MQNKWKRFKKRTNVCKQMKKQWNKSKENEYIKEPLKFQFERMFKIPKHPKDNKRI